MGTPLFLAPELVRQEIYDFKVDVWALGCVIYTLAQQDTPFKGENLVTLGHSIVEQTPKALPRPYSAKFSDFVGKLMAKKAADRPDIGEVLEAISTTIRQAYVPPVRLQPPFRLLLQFPPLPEGETRQLPALIPLPKANEDAPTLKVPPRAKPPLPPPLLDPKPDLNVLSSSFRRQENSQSQANRPVTSSAMNRYRSQVLHCHVEVLPGDVTPASRLPSRTDLPLIYSKEMHTSFKRKMTIKDLTRM